MEIGELFDELYLLENDSIDERQYACHQLINGKQIVNETLYKLLKQFEKTEDKKNPGCWFRVWRLNSLSGFQTEELSIYWLYLKPDAIRYFKEFTAARSEQHNSISRLQPTRYKF
jgi:hypothetical protein